MASIDRRSVEKRLDDLEEQFGPPEDEEAKLRRAVIRDILNEFSRLGACRARNRYRGGTPPTPIQPTDPAGDALGYPYTRGELVEFAIRCVFEREQDEAPDILTHEVTEDLIASWTESMRRGPFGERWERIEAEGPPEPTPPWH
jgi:hypothetical protein